MKFATILIAILLTCCIARDSAAQVHGDCSLGEAEAFLDVNNVRALMRNDGGLFWGGRRPSVYQVPKDNFPAKNSIFTSNIWLGGLVDGELRMTASTYGPWEMWPGPIPQDGSMPQNCTDFDHIYKINRSDIEAFQNDPDSITSDIENWPYELGAPVIDGDGIIENYDISAGDLPRIYGDQSLWWIMNDRGNEHIWSYTVDPLGVEARVTAFALRRPDHFDNTTLYEYEFHNPNDYAIDSTYFGFYVYIDIGNWNDDYMGSDSLLGLGFGWNGLDFDNFEDGYGERPPALGVDIIKGAVVDDDGIDNNLNGEIDETGEYLQTTAFQSFWGGGAVMGFPSSANDAYRYLRSLWRDDVPMTYGGTGRGFTDIPSKWYFSGNPPDYWSEENTDDLGSRNVPSDRRFLIISGPFQIKPHSSQTITFSILWARGHDRFDSVRLLKEASSYVQSGIEAGVHINNFDFGTPEPSIPERLAVQKPYPNPTRNTLGLQFNLPVEEEIKISLFDVQGRQVRAFVDKVYSPGFHKKTESISDLNPGVYFLRYKLGHLSKTFSIVKIAS